MGFEIQNGVLKKYTGTDREVTIPKEITEIGDYAFSGAKQIEKVICSENLRKIGNYSFNACENLRSIVLPEALREIGEHAFHFCTSLSHVDLPRDLVSLSEGVFYACEGLSSIEIPGKVVRVPSEAFRYCSGLEHVKLNTGIESIGSAAFYACKKLEKIDLPETLREIGDGCFKFCEKLDNVIIPDGVEAILDETFRDCSSLKNIYIPDSVTSLHYRSFDNCGFDQWDMPAHIKMVDNYFLCSERLTRLKVSDDLETVPTEVFEECPNLESLYINDAITEFDGPILGDIVVDMIHISTKGLPTLSGQNKLNAVRTFLLDPDTYSDEAKKSWVSYIRRFRMKIMPALIQDNREEELKSALGIAPLTAANYHELRATAGRYAPELLPVLDQKKPKDAEKYEKDDSQPNSIIMTLLNENKAKVSKLRAVRILEASILYGSAQEVKNVYDCYQPFEFLNTAICLCIYVGDKNKLRILMKGHPSIKSTWYIGSLKAKYDYWNEETFFTELVAAGANREESSRILSQAVEEAQKLITHISTPVSGKLGEIKTAVPRDPYLYEMLVKGMEKVTYSKIILTALFKDNIPLAKELLNRGHTLEERDLRGFTDSAAAYDRRRVFSILADYSVEKRNYVLDLIVDALDKFQGKFVFTKAVLDYTDTLFDQTFFKTMCDRCDLKPLGNKELILHLVRDDQTENLRYFIKHKNGKIPRQVVQEVLRSAQEKPDSSCVEVLNQLWKEKYADKMVEIDPESPAAMRKIWSYAVNEENSLTVTGYKGDSTEVAIPREIAGKVVTKIGEYAFSPQKPRIKAQVKELRGQIRTIKIPATVRKIGSSAFEACNEIRTIELQGTELPEGFRTEISHLYNLEKYDGLTESEKYKIVDGIIYDAEQNKILYCPRNYPIKQFVIPDTVRAIAGMTFGCNRGIEELRVPASVNRIEDGALHAMENLNKIFLGIESVSRYLLQWCHNLEEVVLEEGVREISDHAFASLRRLKKIVIPRSCTQIGEDLFPTVGGHSSYDGLFAKYEYRKDFCVFVHSGSFGEKYVRERQIPFAYLE